MSHPIAFRPAPANPREALRARVESAPEEHAEAVLAAYDLLQELYGRGVLDIARSMLAASDELLGTVTESASTPEAIRALRSLLFLGRVLGRIEPESLEALVQGIPDGLASASRRRDAPVSLWTLVRRALSTDSLRGLTAALDVLEHVGRHLHSRDASARNAGP
jgi:uncharacterized protein YjgD (DUF1641 family)